MILSVSGHYFFKQH